MTDTHSTNGTPNRFEHDLAALDDLLDAYGIDAGPAAGIARRPADAPVPMSFAQELLWLLDRATPGLTAYNLPILRRLRGRLDVAALERALSLLVARHESLRLRFAEVDGAPRLIVDPATPLPIPLADVSTVAAEDRERETERLARELARSSFDLSREHLFQASLIRLAADDHVLVLRSHHIVLDGWSMGVIFRELDAAYAAFRAGREPVLPDQAIEFGDFAVWQREQLSGERLTRLLEFWRGQLGDATEPLALPTDHPRPTSPTFAGARQSLALSAEDTAHVRALAHRHDATLYMVLLAAYATVLHRYTGRDNVLVGSGSAGRTLHETESLVGYLNNTLVQRADFSGDPTFAELLGRVRASALGAYDHQEVPLEKLVLELREGSDRLAVAPLFEVVLTMQETMSAGLTLDGLRVEPFGVDMAGTKFDITLLVSDRPEGIQLLAQYRSDLFEPATMQRFLGHVRAVLLAAVAEPTAAVSSIRLVTDEEQRALAAWNETTVNEGTAATLTSLFAAQAARVPDRAAVVAGDATLSYAQLHARACALAATLRSRGVGPNVPVGLLLDRSADAVVGLLGILEAGGAYVPLSVDAPAARIARQLDECGAKLVVSSAALADRLPPTVELVASQGDDSTIPQSDAAPAAAARPEDLAYVLYTSGSTGVPKGVAVTHANVVHYTRAVSRVLGGVSVGQSGDGLAALDGWHLGLASTLAADLGNTSLFPALLSGATLHVLPADVTTDPARFAEYVSAHRLDTLKITPNHLAALVAGKSGAALAAVLPSRWIVFGGEALRPDVARGVVHASACRVLNHYGPTETTVGVLTHVVTSESLDAAVALGAQTVPLGRPLLNTHAYVVDARGQEQPVGIPGELWLGGAGVTSGYLGRPELTAERFVSFRGERVYRTGDRVRRLSDGTLEFLGRADDQVKVRGYRVELGEVEQALRAHPGVEQGVVVLRDEELVAYAVPKQAGYAVSHNDRATPEKLAQWLAAQLPEYMVPSAVVLLDELPLTANGKIDKARLPAADEAAGANAGPVAPRTETEAALVTIWSEVLKRDRIGITDSFLALGGHSLLAIRVLGKISKSFGVRLPLRTLFDSPTVEQLAGCIDAERAAKPAVAEKGLTSRSRDAYRIGKPTTSGSGSEPEA